jgi:hypothetical protein
LDRSHEAAKETDFATEKLNGFAVQGRELATNGKHRMLNVRLSSFKVERWTVNVARLVRDTMAMRGPVHGNRANAAIDR